MYAQLCKRIEKELETDIDKNKSGTFLQILLNVCRDKFENRVQYSEKIINSESTLTDDLEEKKNVAKQKILGNVKFIGELYKLDMLAEPHLHKMLRSLFTNKSSSTTEKNCEDMECLAQLIRTCGKNLDTELGKQLMDQYFDRMEQYSNSSKFPPRIRFMLRDLIELRKNNWTPRKVALVEGPAPIQELNHDDDVLPPSLNHLRNRDRDYRNNDRSEQRDWISKFSLNLQHMNEGFNLMSVSSPSTLLPSSYNHSSNGYASRDHRDNGGGGSNYRIHNNRNNQNNYNNNRYNKHNHHHHQGASGNGGNGSLNNGPSANSPYGNMNMMNNKDLAPRFKRNLMTPPQNSVEELQMRPTPNSLLFKANMNVKTHLPISSSVGGNTVGGSVNKLNFNTQSLSEYPSPHMGRTLLSEQRNAGQNSGPSATNGNLIGSGTGLMNFIGPQRNSLGASGGAPSTMIDDSIFISGESIDGVKNNPSIPNHCNSVTHPGGPRGIIQHKQQSNSLQHQLPNHYNNQQQCCQNHGHGNRGVTTKIKESLDSSMDGNKNAYIIKNYNHQQTVLLEEDTTRPLSQDSIALHTSPNPLATQAKPMKEQVIVSKSSSSENKAEKKIKREKGPGKEEYMKRVVTFVNDVMVANIEQQIEEEKLLHQFGKTQEEVRSSDAEETKTLVKKVLVEVVDKTKHLESSCIDAISGFINERTNNARNGSNATTDVINSTTECCAHSEKEIENNETSTAMSMDATEYVENEKKTDLDLISNIEIDNEPIRKVVTDIKKEETCSANGEIPASAIIRYEMEHIASSTLDYAKEQNLTLMKKLIREFSDLKIPEKCMRDAVIKILNEVLDRSDAYQAKTVEFLHSLKNEAKLSSAASLESFRAIINGMSEKEKTIPKITTIVASLLARGVAVDLCQLRNIASYVDNGQHYPLFLLVLQQLHKQLGRTALLELFRNSDVDLMSSLPESDRSKDRMAEILEDRNLSFLYPLLRVQSELWKQIQADSNPQQFYKWIKENVEPGCYADSGFITAVMTVLLKYIGQETDKLTEDKKRVEKEKEILAKYCPVLNAFLNGYYDRQLTAIYAIQVYWFNIGYPKGVLLRWFQEMYELSVIEEDAFLQYKEDVNDIYPGKGKALFQVNQWLTWLAEAEDEDDEEED
ncbi:transcription factor mef2A-like [Anopheles aquasalis]|uniref:transcription factor mef2A-like n=1 Tax=Anopheles aquasalis TaxID=42839 RepID=UPI00215A53B7|nr:transcription factor mef2A-like [Anopheles aquasalis]